jgi:hypothetical protein
MREEMTLRSTVRAGILQQFRYLAEHRGVGPGFKLWLFS